MKPQDLFVTSDVLIGLLSNRIWGEDGPLTCYIILVQGFPGVLLKIVRIDANNASLAGHFELRMRRLDESSSWTHNVLSKLVMGWLATVPIFGKLICRKVIVINGWNIWPPNLRLNPRRPTGSPCNPLEERT
jgi:hypothetical protein